MSSRNEVKWAAAMTANEKPNILVVDDEPQGR